MIGCLWTRVHKQQIITLYFEFETVLKFYNREARSHGYKTFNAQLNYKILLKYVIALAMVF